jgi:glucose-6-phosphate isomerase
VFINLADIGGRYSALSFFGMAPAAMMGIDFQSLDRAGRRALHVHLPDRSPELLARVFARLGAP